MDTHDCYTRYILIYKLSYAFNILKFFSFSSKKYAFNTFKMFSKKKSNNQRASASKGK
jgi:hypothetical protein